MIRRVLVAMVLVLSVTAGCTGGATLTGTWKVTSASPQVLVAGVDVTLTFGDGEVTGNAGCGAFSSDYAVVDGRLKALSSP